MQPNIFIDIIFFFPCTNTKNSNINKVQTTKTKIQHNEITERIKFNKTKESIITIHTKNTTYLVVSQANDNLSKYHAKKKQNINYSMFPLWHKTDRNTLQFYKDFNHHEHGFHTFSMCLFN